MQDNSKNNVADVINSTLENIKSILNTNASVGNPIKLSETNFVIPISKINVGCLSGGAKVNNKTKKSDNDMPFGGGSGTGFSIIPIGFVCFLNDTVKYINCNQETSVAEDFVNIISKSMNKFVKKEEEKNEKNI